MKAAVEHVKQDFAFSERGACGILQLPVSTFRYRSSRCDAELRDKLVELAREKPRFGYRRLHILLQRAGERVNHKRVWRVYRAAGLCVKRKRRKRLMRVGTPAIAAMMRVNYFSRSYCLSDGCYRRVDVRGKAGYSVESQAEDKAIRGRNLSADLVAGMAGQFTCP